MKEAAAEADLRVQVIRLGAQAREVGTDVGLGKFAISTVANEGSNSILGHHPRKRELPGLLKCNPCCCDRPCILFSFHVNMHTRL